VEEPDWIMMPLAFRDYVTAHAPAVADALPPLDLFDPVSAYAAALEIQLQHDTLHALFDRYLLTGGYPHAMSEEQETGRIGNGAYRIYRDAIIGQMRRAGHDLGPFREVVAFTALDSSAGHVSANTEIGSKDTARRYLENAERLYLWHILYRAQATTRRPPSVARRSSSPSTHSPGMSWPPGRAVSRIRGATCSPPERDTTPLR
jgi:predicted AAA+ superfamily ATPase